MAIKRTINEVCPKCGERNARLENGWVHWPLCRCAGQGPVPAPPRRVRESEVIFVPSADPAPPARREEPTGERPDGPFDEVWLVEACQFRWEPQYEMYVDTKNDWLAYDHDKRLMYVHDREAPSVKTRGDVLMLMEALGIVPHGWSRAGTEAEVERLRKEVASLTEQARCRNDGKVISKQAKKLVKLKEHARNLEKLNIRRGRKLVELEARLKAINGNHDEFRDLIISKEKETTRLQNAVWELEEAVGEVSSDRNRLVREKLALEQERDALRADNHRLRLGDMSVFDYERLIEWINNADRKDPHFAFTAGSARTAARAILDSGVLSSPPSGAEEQA